ncbi:TrmB family transcriptional regulator [Methanosphaerula palustris]|nr:TrmB family transcriptional regulator [Methanosphaerula palustris]
MNESGDSVQSPAEALKSLGLTKYEALVYIGLLRVNEATATEVHEISGVPRASVYPVLDRLVQRDIVSVSHTSPRRFCAFPPEDGVKRLMHRIEDQAEYVTGALQEIYTERSEVDRGAQDLIWTIYGTENIMSRLAEALTHAEEEVWILSCWKMIEKSILPMLMEGIERNVRIEIATDRWEGDVPPGLVVRIKKPPKGHDRFGRDAGGGLFLIDQHKVMAIVNAMGEKPTALYSESDGFLKLFMQFWNIIERVEDKKDKYQ